MPEEYEDAVHWLESDPNSPYNLWNTVLRKESISHGTYAGCVHFVAMVTTDRDSHTGPMFSLKLG